MNLELKHKIYLEIVISFFLFIFYYILFINVESLIQENMFATSDSVIFPRVLLFVQIIATAYLFVFALTLLKNLKAGKITHYMQTLVTDAGEQEPFGRICIYITTLFIYIAGFYYLGFIIATPVIMLFVAYLLGLRKFIIAVPAAIIFTLILNYTSLYFLQILLPKGALFS